MIRKINLKTPSRACLACKHRFLVLDCANFERILERSLAISLYYAIVISKALSRLWYPKFISLSIDAYSSWYSASFSS